MFWKLLTVLIHSQITVRMAITDPKCWQIAHSMGGLDARYMISHLHPANVTVRSLVTVASPHHGSSFADFLFQEIGSDRLPKIYKLLERVGVETGAFEQLTSTYMINDFNPRTPDDPEVSYFSYGASK